MCSHIFSSIFIQILSFIITFSPKILIYLELCVISRGEFFLMPRPPLALVYETAFRAIGNSWKLLHSRVVVLTLSHAFHLLSVLELYPVFQLWWRGCACGTADGHGEADYQHGEEHWFVQGQEATRSASAHFCHHRFNLQVHATMYAKRERISSSDRPWPNMYKEYL